MKNEIHFENVKVNEVLEQLRRWYDYELDMQDKTKLDEEISIHILSSNVTEVIKVISVITDTEVVQNAKRISFIEK